MALTLEWLNRINQWRHTMPRLFYRELGRVTFDGFVTKDQLTVEEAERRRFKPMPAGTAWGAKWEYAWFRATISLPASSAGERIVLKTDLCSDEAAVYVNGVHAGARDYFHQEITLARKARGGDTFRVLLEAYAGHGPRECAGGPCPHGHETVPEPGPTQAKVGVCSFGIWEEELYQLWIDTQTLFEMMERMADRESLRVAAITDALKELTLVVDLELPRAEMLKTVQRGRALLRPLLDARNGSTAPFMHAYGHSHIDVAWLWPLRETEAKCTRTFGTQLALMDEYPEYKFLQSQCHLYWMMKQRYPRLYARIKKAVKKGQWIPDGGTWVEADTNISGGESLIRQFIHGKRFYKQEFGVDSELLWLPDVFGYSAALPQIMAGCGVKYFSTMKIFWIYNGGDPFPYNLFWWEGIDGTRVLSYLHNDYSCTTNPATILTRWNERVQKDTTHPGRLLPFGWGDGGGGPTRDHLEFLRRLKDLEGCPKCHIDAPSSFFKNLETDNLPRWVGELYFQAHRGTYTSQAKTKKGNRAGEFALREAEVWGAAAAAIAGFRYPLGAAEDLWRTVLLNQFHDVIPGSSISRVYVEAEAAHAQVIAQAGTIADKARASLLSKDRDTVTVFNSLSWDRDAVVKLPSGFTGGETEDGTPVPTQNVDGAVYGLVRTVPSCGWVSVRKTKAQADEPSVKASPTTLENELLRVTFNRRGEITSIFDKENHSEFAMAPCNVLHLYKDVPSGFDAWDIDSMYKVQEVHLAGTVKVTAHAAGPVFGSVRLTRRIGNSRLEQDIVLRSGSRRVDFRTRIDWQESHKLLKVNFPVTLRAEDALHEIQFGHVRRPTHASQEYDAARFEVCNQKWTALVEENRGAAILNDCKYGVNVEGSSINLTLLKSALAPDMTADKGMQEFTYAFYCWNGAFKDSGVVQAAYELNVPATVAPGRAKSASLFTVGDPNVIIETVKPAEDGSGDVVVRVYEAARCSVTCDLRTSLPITEVAETNMLEQTLRKVRSSAGKITLSFRPFEIKTLRLKVSRRTRRKP